MIAPMYDALRRRRWPLAVIVASVLALVPSTARASNDPLFAKQWALRQIDAPSAWSASTGSGVRIGIVDTGVDLAHEDLGDKVVAHTSCIDTGGDPGRCRGSGQDDHGHGTHLAGVAAATKDNGKGVAGVAPGAQLVVAKSLNFAGAGNLEDINAGIRWVVDHDADVVNLSVGEPLFVLSSLFGTGLREGIDYAWAHGAVPVLASGNSDVLGLGLGSSDYGDLPALVVGATNRHGRVTDYSSPTGNARWALLAPGGAGTGTDDEDVLSSSWVEGEANQYRAEAGTSIAAPHVAGAVAVLLAKGSTPQEAVDRILQTVDTSAGCGANSPTCRGRLDVARAVGTRAGPPVAFSSPAPPPAVGERLTRLLGPLL
ncbi:MAG TPA: S8 family serine peptidase, partial [Acidimicrobiales bacterium]|nr:S8 family serine peptidase [Acidimicrobiales bacterium]